MKLHKLVIILLISHCTFAQNTSEILPSTDDETITVLDLSKRNLENLKDYDFSKYPSLIEVDLSNNKLKYIKENTFVNNLKLKKVNLSGNKKLTLPKFSTLLIANIEELNLTNCNIKELPTNILDGLTTLKTIDLSENPLGEDSIQLFTLSTLRNPEKIILPAAAVNKPMIKTICKDVDLTFEIKNEGSKNLLKCEDVKKDIWNIENKETPEFQMPISETSTKQEIPTSDTTQTNVENVKEKEQTTEATTNTNEPQTDNTKEQEETTKTNTSTTLEKEQTTEASTLTDLITVSTTVTQTPVVEIKSTHETTDTTKTSIENSDNETTVPNTPQDSNISTILPILPIDAKIPVVRPKILEPRDPQTTTTTKQPNVDDVSAKHEHKETSTTTATFNQNSPQEPTKENDKPSINNANHETQPLPPATNELAQISEENATSQKPDTRIDQEEAKLGEATSGSSSAGTSILIFLVCGVVVAGIAAFGYKFYKSRKYQATRTVEPIEQELKEIVVEKNSSKTNSITEEEPLMQKRENGGFENADLPNNRSLTNETPTNPKSTTHEIRANSFGNGPYMPTTTTFNPNAENANSDNPKPR